MRINAMKKIIALLAAILALAAPAQAQFSKSTLAAQIAQDFPDQSAGVITPSILRGFLNNFVSSTQQFLGVNPQAGTSYTFLPSDYGQLVTLNNALPVAVTLPQAIAPFFPWNVYVKNIGVGTATITPQGGSTINGAASLSLAPNAAAQIISDGTNYQVFTSSLIVGVTGIAGGASTATSHGILFNKNGLLGDSANDPLGGPLVINNSGFVLPALVNNEIPALILSGAQDSSTQGETQLVFDTFGANSNGTILMNKSGGGSVVTGSISGNVLTVSAVTFGSLAVNQIVMAPALATGTTIASLGTGAGGTGTYNLSNSATVAPGTTILTNDSPLHPTATQAQEGLGFIISAGWYGSPAARTFGTAEMRFFAEGVYTSTSWPTSINFFTTPVNSTTAQLAFTLGSGFINTFFTPGVGATNVFPGLVIKNATAAALGAQQNSASIDWIGQAWNTGASASQTIEWVATNVPTQGNPPTTALVFSHNINSAGYIRDASVLSTGFVDAAAGFSIAGSPLAFSNLAGSLPSGVAAAGFIEATEIAAPSNPPAGKVRIYAATTDNLKVQSSAGLITTTVVPIAAVSNKFATSMDNTGTIALAFPDVSGLTGLGTGVATFLGTPTSANLRAALTDESGTGAAVFGTSPTITTPNIVGTATNDNAAALSVGEYVSSNCPGQSATVTITIASPAVITYTAHGMTGICPIVFTTTGALPTGITASTVYWTISSTVAANTFQIATSIANAVAGTAINTSGSQSGTQTGTQGVTTTTTVQVDTSAISLTAGDWNVWGTISNRPAGSTTNSVLGGWISTTSATFPAKPNNGAYQFVAPLAAAGTPTATTVGQTRLSLAGTTTVFLTCYEEFAVSTNGCFGFIGARRVR